MLPGRVGEVFLEPTTHAHRLACESLIGLSVGDALGARWEGSGFNPIHLTADLDADDGTAHWTDDTQPLPVR